MGYLNDFAAGFFKTSAETVLDRKKRQEVIDDKRKEAIALIDPQAELKKRYEDIERQSAKDKQKDLNEEFMNQLARMNGTAPTTPAPTSNVDMPDGFVSPSTTGAAGGSFMTPPTTTPPPVAQPEDEFSGLTKVHKELQDALRFKAIAGASGNKQQEAYWDTVVDMKKSQYTYLSDNAKNNSKPITSAEGTNIADQVQKDNEEKLKNPTKYQSDYLPPKINGLLQQPEIGQLQQDSVIKHSALAQAVADVKKRANPAASTEEVYPLIKEQTKKIITNINVVNSQDTRVTPEDKKKAIADIELAIKAITKDDPNVLEALKSDPNYAAIFDDATIANIAAITGGGDKIPTDSPAAKPVLLKGDQSSTKALSAAKAAIARGAPRDKVIQRLQENGIDTTGL